MPSGPTAPSIPGHDHAPETARTRRSDEPHMLSFNHYAYGAVIDWVYRHVAGLAPDPRAAGLPARRRRAAAGRRVSIVRAPRSTARTGVVADRLAGRR